jgi:tetratricopeptide (TPR) repeat protein
VRLVLLIASLGGLLLAQQSNEEIKLRKDAVEKNPQDAEAHARLGIAYQNAGLLGEAAQSLETSIGLNPNLPRVPILLAFVYMAAGRYGDAVPLLRQMFQAEQEVDMRLVVGQRLVECLFTIGGEEEALEVVGKLRRLKPDDPDVLFLASKAHANLWNSTVQRLLEKSSDSYRAHQILAEVLETQEKYSAAAAEYRTIIRLHPRLPAFHYRLGRMLLRADPSAEGEKAAMAEFRAELEINPFDVPSHVEIGDLELKAGRVEEGFKFFSRAVALQPGHANSQLGLARAFIAGKQFEKALDPLEQARRLAPQNEAVFYQKMIALRSLGRQAEARQAQADFQKLKAEKDRSVAGIRDRLKTGTPLAGPAP